MKQYNTVSLVIGLTVFILTIWVFFLIMKFFTGLYPGKGNDLGIKGRHNVVQRFILDSASRSWHIETRLMDRGKEGPMINLEVIPANQYQSKEEVDTKSVTHLGK